MPHNSSYNLCKESYILYIVEVFIENIFVFEFYESKPN